MKKTIAALALAATALTAPAANAMTLDCGKGDTPPCPSEDSTNTPRCVWDGRHMGNGQGRSYILVMATDGADPAIIYIKHRRAHRLMTTCA